jgi:hypothetical protein
MNECNFVNPGNTTHELVHKMTFDWDRFCGCRKLAKHKKIKSNRKRNKREKENGMWTKVCWAKLHNFIFLNISMCSVLHLKKKSTAFPHFPHNFQMSNRDFFYKPLEFMLWMFSCWSESTHFEITKKLCMQKSSPFCPN